MARVCKALWTATKKKESGAERGRAGRREGGRGFRENTEGARESGEGGPARAWEALTVAAAAVVWRDISVVDVLMVMLNEMMAPVR